MATMMSAENGSAKEPHAAGDETADANPAALATAITESNSSSTPRAKINISLGGKKKKKTSNNKNNLLSSADGKSLLAEEYSTIAEEAEIISQKRKEEGAVLVIPCAQGANDEEKRKHPLLAGRMSLLQKGDGAAISAANDDEKDVMQLQNNADDKKDATKTNSATNDALEDEVVKQLISESKKDKDNADSTTASGRGLVIAAPSQNKLITGSDQTKEQTTSNTANIVNEDEQFQQELSHHANDVDPTSSVYANVAISDFGSALLRGMGWTGGDNNKSGGGGKKNEETIKARPHRLGLGATPLPLPSATTTNSSRGGIHRRARRPDEVKRDEERQKQQEEAERIAAEKKQLDVQVTLQPGSVVHVRDENKRAKVVKTAGVPGLNRILIQFEGSDKDVSVAKNSVKLCSWEELDVRPFFQEAKVSKSNEREQSPRNGSSLSRRKRSRSYDSADDEQRYRKDRTKRQSSTRSSTVHEEQYHDRDDVSDDDSRDRKRRSKKHKRRKHHRRERSYSRSRSRSHSPDYKKRRKHESHRTSCKSQSSDSQKQQPQHHINWLIPNIRVRIVSKKIPAYYLQKGVVQDVTRTSQSSTKAVLLMDNGQVIDKVPERYLETALPKAGGNIIVLEGSHHWKKGKLLERSSEGGYGLIQFAEDLEVITVSLDSIAEYCIDCDE